MLKDFLHRSVKTKGLFICFYMFMCCEFAATYDYLGLFPAMLLRTKKQVFFTRSWTIPRRICSDRTRIFLLRPWDISSCVHVRLNRVIFFGFFLGRLPDVSGSLHIDQIRYFNPNHLPNHNQAFGPKPNQNINTAL